MSSTTSSAPNGLLLPDYLPVPQSALGPALNDQGYYVGCVERNLFWVTDGTYQSAFLATNEGIVLFDAPPTIGHNLRRAVDEIAESEGVANTVTHLVYSHHHAQVLPTFSVTTSSGLATRTHDAFSCATTIRPGPPQR